MTRPLSRRWSGRDECGQIGGIEAVTFGVLIFVLGTLVIANAWGVVDAKLAAGAAAREAARAYVEAPSPTAAEQAALTAATATIEGHGRSPSRMDTPSVEGAFARCARIRVTVRYHVPLIALPLLGRSGDGFTVSARHSEIVDPYRSGLPGESSCG